MAKKRKIMLALTVIVALLFLGSLEYLKSSAMQSKGKKIAKIDPVLENWTKYKDSRYRFYSDGPADNNVSQGNTTNDNNISNPADAPSEKSNTNPADLSQDQNLSASDPAEVVPVPAIPNNNEKVVQKNIAPKISPAKKSTVVAPKAPVRTQGGMTCPHHGDKPSYSKTKGKHMDEDCCPDPDEWANPRCSYSASGYSILISKR